MFVEVLKSSAFGTLIDKKQNRKKNGIKVCIFLCPLPNLSEWKVAVGNYQPIVYMGTIEFACDMHQQPWYYELVNCYMRTLFFLLLSRGNHVKIETENRNFMAFTVWYYLVLNDRIWFEKFLKCTGIIKPEINSSDPDFSFYWVSYKKHKMDFDERTLRTNKYSLVM